MRRLLDFLEPGLNITSERHVERMTNLKSQNAHLRLEKRETFRLLHDNPRLHRRSKTTECLTKFGLKVLSHAPFDLDMAPSDLHLLGHLKDALRGQHISDNNAVITATRKKMCRLGRR